jgi:bacterioferritin
VPEILACDLKLESAAQATVKEGMAYCESVKDYASRDLFQDILNDTEEHIDWLETQIGLVDQVGLQNYLQSQV